MTSTIITIAVLYLLTFGAVYGFSKLVPVDSRAGKLSRKAICALLGFVPTMVAWIKAKMGAGKQ